MATLDEVAQVLASAMPVYSSFHVPVGRDLDFYFATWHRYVGHLDAVELQDAMDNAVRNCPQFMPTPADVLKALGRIRSNERKTALEAWAVVLRSMAIWGNYHPPKPGPYPLQANIREWEFDDPLIGEAVAGIGWANLFEGAQDTMRAHFLHYYDAMVLKQMQRAAELPAPDAERVKELQP